MKKRMLTKIVLALGMIGSVSVAQAQWAVSNVNDAAYFSPTGIFTQVMGQLNSAVTNSVDLVRQAQGIQVSQSQNNQIDTDQRNRTTIVQADILKRNFEQLPTIAQCVDLTRSSVATGGTAAAVSSHAGGPNGGGSSSPLAPAVAPTLLTTSANVSAQIISSKSSIGTCDPTYDTNVANCGSSTGAFAGADLRMIGIKANVEKHVTNMDFTNWTMDGNAYQVALKNAENTTLANAPKFLDPKKYNNPAYQSLYQGVMQHLFAAEDALLDIATLRKAPLGTLGDAQQTVWSSASTDYASIFGTGVTAPTAPSFFELLNYEVYSDYEGVRADETKITDEISGQRQIAQRLALNNMIAWQQYKQTENTNILLSHLLAVTTTPVNKAALDSMQTNAAASTK